MSYLSEVLADNPRAYYRLDEASGAATMLDSSGNSLNGSYQNGPALGATGLIAEGGTSADFSVVSGLRAYRNGWSTTGAYTAEAWINADAISGSERTIVAHDDNGANLTWRLFVVGATQKVMLYHKDGSGTMRTITSGRALVVGRTYHVVATWDGANLRLYINAVLEATLAVVGVTGGSTPLNIGGLFSSITSEQFDGRIDEVAVYDGALSQSRITAHYRAGVGAGPYPSEVLADTPLAYYRHGEAAGLNMIDSSGLTGRNGTYNSVALGQPGLQTSDGDTAVALDGSYSTPATVAYATWMNVATAFTVEMWIKTSSVAALQTLISRDTNSSNKMFSLCLANGIPQMILYDGAATYTCNAVTAINDGQPHHIVVTVDSAALTVKIYVDGVLVDTDGGKSSVSGTPALNIGSKRGIDRFVGTVDETAYYGYVLSDARVAAHYAARTPAAPDPPTDLVQTGATTDSIEFTFSYPVTGSAPTSYEYRLDGGAPVNMGLPLTYSVSGLSPGTDYLIEVRSVNDGGTSSWVGTVMSTEAIPIAEPPTNLQQTGATTDSITFAFVAPASGLAPTSYRYRVDGGPAVDIGLATSATISFLETSTSYSVEVLTVSGTELSAWTPAVLMSTSAAPTPPVAGITRCYDPVRGSAIRVTGLDRCGAVPDVIEYATSKSVIKITIREVVDSPTNEIVANPEGERRLRLSRPSTTIRNLVDIEFTRVDPGVLSLIANVTSVHKESLESAGFGEFPFGAGYFGSAQGEAVGFEVNTRSHAVAFGLEVWSKLAGNPCAADGEREWGFTVFPFLKGGRISGFRFANGLVSFNLIGARTMRRGKWGVGPHDLTGTYERLLTPVSGNAHWRTFITTAQPPAQVDGVQSKTDVLDNGTPDNPMPDPDAALVVDAGGVVTDPWIIDGGTP